MSQAIYQKNEANQLEKKYRWLEAITKYQQALVTLKINNDYTIKASQIQGRIGHCYYMVAHQADTSREFLELIAASQRANEKATSSVPNREELENKVYCLQYDAKQLFLKALIENNPDERREILDESLDVGRQLLKQSSSFETQMKLQAATEFLHHLEARIDLAIDYNEIRSFIEEAQNITEFATRNPTLPQNSIELNLIHLSLSKIILDWPLAIYDSIEEQKNAIKRSIEYAEGSYKTALQLEDSLLIGSSAGVLAYLTFEIKGDLEASQELANIQLKHAKRTGDMLRLAQSYELLSYLTSWKTNTADEDPKIQSKENRKTLELAKDAIEYFNLVRRPATIAYFSHLQSYSRLAKLEKKTEEKKKLIDQGIKIAKKDLENARKMGNLLGIIYVLNDITHLLFGSIRLATEKREKIDRLKETESIVSELIDTANKIQPYRYWNLSVFKQHSAMINIEKASIETNAEKRKELLLKSLSEGDECIKLSKLHLDSHPSKTLFLDYAVGLKRMGELLEVISSVTKDTTYLSKAVDINREIIAIYQQYELPSRIAEIHWYIASLYGKIGDYLNSSKQFELASKYYRESMKKIPSLAEFYLDYTKYMEAWSQISQAKYQNTHGQYGKVRQHYEKAAQLHMETKRWSYLAKNYTSWAKLAEAEDLSQREKTVEARDLFRELAGMFEDSKKGIESHIKSIDIYDEQQLASKLIDASERRGQYCTGRMTLEEAKILDNQGENAASSIKYGEASQIFEDLNNSLETESERIEIRPITQLSKAWQFMTQAEAESAPNQYLNAAELFENVKDCSITLKTKTMAQGHSYLCRALYESSQFESTRNLENYRSTNQYLNLAANSYLKAGYDRALEYSKAMQRLFDAYFYIDNANNEQNPEQKAKFLALAERLLEESAKSYSKAKYPAKRDEVTKLLRNVRRDQQLALSLAQVMHAPPISSSIASFSLPLSNLEYPVGLKDFEHANIQSSIYLKSQEIKMSDHLEMVIVLSNTGKTTASLNKIENLVTDEFDAVTISSYYSFRGKIIDLKGKRLGPLGTEEIEITLSPKTKGEYKIKPKIFFQTETGESKYCEPKPVEIRISKLGLSNWLRGPKTRRTC